MSTTTLRVGLLDSVFELRGPAGTLAEIGRLLPASPIQPDDPALIIDVGAHESVVEALTVLNMTAIAQCRSFAVHAGVVSTPAGAIAFPAASGGGKSTITAACLLAGFDYLSDEALVVDWDAATVRPYPKWLSLSPWSAQHVGLAPRVGVERVYTAGELSAKVAPAGLPLAHVVLLRRTGGPPRLEPVSRALAAHHLLTMSFNHYQRPEPAFSLVCELVRGASAWVLELDGGPEAATLLRRELSA